MKIRSSHIIFVLLSTIVGTASTQPTIYIIRHAEKLATWLEDDALEAFHPLSAEGVARAQKLTEQFQPGAIAAIFSSRTTRALHTALPLSQKLNLPVEVVDACMDTAAIAPFYKNLAQRFGPDKSVVLVSHSNIIPYLLLKAGLPRACFKEMRLKDAAPNEWLLSEGYDNIWQVKKSTSAQSHCADFTRKIF
jgi:broad specificity phosphatase PhoE